MDKKVTTETKKVTSTVGKFAATGSGLIVGAIGASKIPSFGLKWVEKILPGLLIGILGYVGFAKLKNAYACSAALGLGTSGFFTIVYNFLKDSDNATVKKVAAAIKPASGLGQYTDQSRSLMGVGQYDPQSRLLLGLGEASEQSSVPAWLM